MDATKKRENLRALIETAMLVAVGFVLSYITLFRMPQGGSVTPLSMLPILIIGLRHGLKWGLMGGFVYAGLQMLQGFWLPHAATPWVVLSVVMLDYVLAFTVLGLSGLFKGRKYGIMYAAPICIFLRFLSHFISGVFVWSEAPFAEAFSDGAIWLFSLTYNGSYMGVELVSVTVVGILISKVAPFLMTPKSTAA